ncbi:class I adenylate-forming enzyme family protein [Curvivirga aplysinae]|uniref:class I adenylate-forming enzyme family protein n=1 Tax=Curvivirga aplysinae TaxID=2529852 RepID=UPI0012BC9F50|nr:class I adenylate-forming enzyme family protein [Curvivirga aplysinae]MTI09293.1 long-chain fatty acid--CoA ligase [Curvivirga aplysinae]
MIQHIGQLLPRHAKYRPNHQALWTEGNNYTFQEFHLEVNKVGHALCRAGLRKGDHFATILPNGFALMALYWAAAETGTVIVPMSPLLQAEGLKSLINDSDSKMIFADASFASTLSQILPELDKIDQSNCILCDDDINSFNSWNNFISESSDAALPDINLTSSDIFNIMYSSGTTGLPKGIIHTHEVRANYCTGFASCLRISPESVILHTGSIVFNGAMIDLMPWMYLGARYILHTAFDVDAMLSTIEEEKVTHVVMVPAQIIAILTHPNFDPEKMKSLEMILSVGAPLLMDYKEKLNEVLPNRFYELYGLTEGFATVLDCTVSMQKTGSVGTPPPFYEMKILRPDGSECDIDEPGEIVGRSPVMSPGYYKRPELTKETFRDGWIYTGDVGKVDKDGYLYLVDRIKDMIISGGVNIYPKDIEELIIQHPKVTDVSVFGVEDDRWGEKPIAAITCSNIDEFNKQELINWTNERVAAKFQRIHDIYLLNEFPRNVAGKTLKREIKENYLKEAGI